jgi:hypothetical protein
MSAAEAERRFGAAPGDCYAFLEEQSIRYTLLDRLYRADHTRPAALVIIGLERFGGPLPKRSKNGK